MAMSEEEKKFWYQRFTLKGRMFYPEILEPKAGSNGRIKYSMLFAFKSADNSAERQRIEQFLKFAKDKYHANIPQQFWNSPLKHFNTYVRTDGRPNHEFLRDCYFINLATGADMPPMVVDANRQVVMDKAEVYSGRNVAISLSFWLNNGGKDGTGKKGVGANLNGVMLLPGGEREGGAGAASVDEIFGGFAQDMGLSVPQAQPAPQPQQAWNPQQPAQQPTGQQWPPTNNNGNTFI